MNRQLAIIALILLLSISVVSATTNLDFRLDVGKEAYYPNEKIPLTVTVTNRDASLSARDAELTINIGERFYTFDVGNLGPGDIFKEEITLPEFPAATHSVRGVINYTGILGERFTETTYGSFEVLFPPIERYPRNVFVSDYNLPEKIIGGKEYDVSITVTNDGEVSADLLLEFGSQDEFFTEETTLASGDSKTVSMNVKFQEGGVSLIEARAYALINGEKYLLNYRGRTTFVQEERNAKLSFDKIELIGEGDGEINQEDAVKFKIFIKNEGDTATEVKGELSSDVDKLELLDSSVSYVTIGSEDSISPSDDTFEIETKNVKTGDYNLNLKLSYVDSENRQKTIEVPISISEGGDSCSSDNECSDTQTCENNKCKEVQCTDGFVKNRQCIKYECVRDAQCSEFESCNEQIHKCVGKTGCFPVLQNGNSEEKLDILFVGDGYASNDEFKDKVLKLVDYDGNSGYNGLMSVEPFKTQKSKFNIWMVTAPEYKYRCDENSCEPDINDVARFESTCPQKDTSIVVSKKTYRSFAYFGGSAFTSIDKEQDKHKGRLILHEFGHSFGRLADEYSENGKSSRPHEPNCAPDAATAKEWWGHFVGMEGVGYYEGCSYTSNNIRPTKMSIMFQQRHLDYDYEPVNENRLKTLLEEYR